MNAFMKKIKAISDTHPSKAEDLMDIYTNEVIGNSGSLEKSDQEDTIREYKRFYDDMEWSYPISIMEYNK